MLENIIVIVVLALIAGAIIWYIYRAKKSGQKCIGCPASKTCSGKCGHCDSNCHCSDEKEGDVASSDACPHCNDKKKN